MLRCDLHNELASIDSVIDDKIEAILGCIYDAIKYFICHGLIFEGIKLCQETIDTLIAHKCFTYNSEVLNKIIYILIVCYRDNSQSKLVTSTVNKIIEAGDSNIPDGSPRMIKAYMQAASLFGKIGMKSKAEYYSKKALSLVESCQPGSLPELYRILNNLGVLRSAKINQSLAFLGEIYGDKENITDPKETSRSIRTSPTPLERNSDHSSVRKRKPRCKGSVHDSQASNLLEKSCVQTQTKSDNLLRHSGTQTDLQEEFSRAIPCYENPLNDKPSVSYEKLKLLARSLRRMRLFLLNMVENFFKTCLTCYCGPNMFELSEEQLYSSPKDVQFQPRQKVCAQDLTKIMRMVDNMTNKW